MASKSTGLSEGASAAASVRETSAAPPASQDEVATLRGASARIVENMEASLTIPTATSYRAIPVKLLEENRQTINEHPATGNRGKVSYTHIIAWAIVQALKEFPALNSFFQFADGAAHRVTRHSINLGVAIDVERKDGTRSLLVPNIKENEPFVNTAHVDNLMEHKWILPKEVMHFFLMESFNDDEQAAIVCIGAP